MQQFFNQLLQFLQQGISAIFRFVHLIWTWSVEQVSTLMQAPWQNWPFWKQILLVLVLAGVVWALYKAAKETLGGWRADFGCIRHIACCPGTHASKSDGRRGYRSRRAVGP